jgi:hypothetical protein
MKAVDAITTSYIYVEQAAQVVHTHFFLYSFKNNSELSAYISSILVHKLPQYA